MPEALFEKPIYLFECLSNMESHSNAPQCLTQLGVSFFRIILLAPPLKEHGRHSVGDTGLVIGQIDSNSSTDHLQASNRKAIQLSRGGDQTSQVDDHFVSQFTSC